MYRLTRIFAVVREHHDCLNVCNIGTLYSVRLGIHQDLGLDHIRSYIGLRKRLVLPLRSIYSTPFLRVALAANDKP